MQANTKPTIRYSPFGESGNVYWIIGMAQKALKSQGKDVDILKEVHENAESHMQALQIISNYVELVDITK